MLAVMCQGRFTHNALSGMLARPEDRTAAVAKLFESAGGRLTGWYLTFGDYDWMVVGEVPSEAAAASIAIAASAGGGVSGIRTTFMMPGAQARDAFAQAQKIAPGFKSAGQA